MADTLGTYQKPYLKPAEFDKITARLVQVSHGEFTPSVDISGKERLKELLKGLCAHGIAARMNGGYVYIPQRDPKKLAEEQKRLASYIKGDLVLSEVELNELQEGIARLKYTFFAVKQPSD